jgi:hypothetical protein
MSGSFRRAHLRGSDELFRPTRPDEDAASPVSSVVAPIRGPGEPSAHSDASLGVQRPDGNLIRLTDEEVEILVDAVQKLKYPTATKVPTKPPMDVYERLEELRQKLLGHHT